MITDSIKRLIERVINVFETGTPAGKYNQITILADGKNGTRQITYGRSQTTEQGNLAKLIELYIRNNGLYAEKFSSYIDKIGKQSLTDNKTFKDLLRTSANEDPIMKETQDEFFDLAYYNPAFEFFTKNGFELPLSLLVIYDSYIHSGSIPQALRKRFGEFPPAKGGDEKKWITSYVDIRHQWLKYHTNPILQRTIYRTQCFKDQITAENWMLDKLPIIANSTAVNV
ncbi:MAG: chitosanase [Ignavibacteriales bacterium]|nr:chitosanase [Ignavibacteriales bacterium]